MASKKEEKLLKEIEKNLDYSFEQLRENNSKLLKSLNSNDVTQNSDLKGLGAQRKQIFETFETSFKQWTTAKKQLSDKN